MITYILKLVACSGLLLAIYHLFLATERIYVFNRFYLLFSFVFSFAVPLITLKTSPAPIPPFEQKLAAQKVSAIADGFQNRQNKTEDSQIEKPGIQPAVSTVTQAALTQVNRPVYHQTFIELLYAMLPTALLFIYLAGALIMLIRFVSNSYRIGKTIARSENENTGDIKLVLLHRPVAPHSFFNYVFLNKAEYDGGFIGPEIICHERAHVSQLHSLDVLFVELVHALCWFNPVILLYRRAIQLNHEFLADETVLKNYNNTPAYQQLLLTRISQQSGLYLTSQFNYSITKKRLMMMTKRTPTKMALLKQLAIAPVVAGTVLLFSQKVMAGIVPATGNAAFKKTDDAKQKKKFAQAVRGKTIEVEIKGIYKNKNGLFVGFLASYGANDYIIESWYGQEKQLNSLIKAGDKVTLKVFATSFSYQDDAPVSITPAFVIKGDQKIFQLAEADKMPDYPFLVESNTVRHTEGQITNIVKYTNGKWKTALLETVNGYKFKLSFKPDAPNMKSVKWGDHVSLRFVNGVKTRAKEYEINDWVSIITYGQVYKNPHLFNKYYSNNKPNATDSTKSHS